MSPAPRLLALVHVPPPVHGSALMGRQLLEGGVGRSVEIRAIPLRFARGLDDLGRASPRKAALAAGYGLRQLAALLRHRPHAGYVTGSTAGGAMVRDAAYMRLFRLFRTPYAVHVHTMGLADSLAAAPAPVRWWVRGGFRGAAVVIALTEAHAADLARVVPADRVRIVPNGLPDATPGRGAPPPGAAAPGRDRLLFLSNMMEAKGPLVLLEALPAIRAVVPGVRPTFAGGWPDPSLRRRFLDRSRELGLDGWLDVRGPVDEDEKLELLDGTAVLAFPSFRECMPLVVLEAMRHGVPVVAARIPGMAELLGDGGVTVPAGDPAALADAVAALLRDPGRAGSMGRAARARYQARHGIEGWERAMAALLRSLAEGRPFTRRAETDKISGL